MSTHLRRPFWALASTSFIGFALSTGAGCATVAASPPQVPPAEAVAAAAAEAAPPVTTSVPAVAPIPRDDTSVAAKKVEIAALEALVDQEKRALASNDLAVSDRRDHQSALRNLEKMQRESHLELADLEKAPTSTTTLTSAIAVAPATLPKAPSVEAPEPSASAALPTGAALPAAAKLEHAAPGLGSAVAGLRQDPKGAAMGLAKLGAARVPGGSSVLGAAGAVAGLAHDPKVAAMDLAKQGVARLPGGSALLGAASAVSTVAADPKGAAKDLAKQGVMAAANKVPIPGALKSSALGLGGLTR